MTTFTKMPAGDVRPGDVIARTRAGADPYTVTRTEPGAVSLWIYLERGGRIRPRATRLLWVCRPAPTIDHGTSPDPDPETHDLTDGGGRR